MQPMQWCIDDGDQEGLLAEWQKLSALSFDHAVLEHAPSLLVVELDLDWADLGTWDSVSRVLEDHAGTAFSAAGLVQEDARRNVVYAPGRTVALLGVEDLVVVATDDAILVMPRARAQELRGIVEFLAESGQETLL